MCTIKNRQTAIQFSSHAPFKCRPVWFESEQKIWHTGGDCLYSQWQWLIRWNSTPKAPSICLSYLADLPLMRVLCDWNDMNQASENICCLQSETKKVYFHNLQSHIIILAKGAGVSVCVAMVAGVEKAFQPDFLWGNLSLWLWVFRSSSCNRKRCAPGLITN